MATSDQNSTKTEDRKSQVLDILLKILTTLGQLWSSLSDDQKESICQAFTELMEDLFRAYYKANAGAAQ